MASRPLTFTAGDGTRLAGEESGKGAPLVLLHGLTATRRYVVMGSRLLERNGYRVISYDARGHGCSGPAPARDAYGYQRLASDLLTVLDELGVDRAILAGASMGAHTAVRLALSSPERVAALCLITPAYDPLEPPTGRSLAVWDTLARGLRQGGVQGFLDAYDFSTVPESWRATVERVVSQRLARHKYPSAVADALEVVPRSQPFERLEQLGLIEVPTVVVGSRDEADPTHPLALAETYARTIPSARLLVELPGQSPLAWQGAQLSRVIVNLISTGEVEMRG